LHAPGGGQESSLGRELHEPERQVPAPVRWILLQQDRTLELRRVDELAHILRDCSGHGVNERFHRTRLTHRAWFRFQLNDFRALRLGPDPAARSSTWSR